MPPMLQLHGLSHKEVRLDPNHEDWALKVLCWLYHQRANVMKCAESRWVLTLFESQLFRGLVESNNLAIIVLFETPCSFASFSLSLMDLEIDLLMFEASC
jgi:hypothetical protein